MRKIYCLLLLFVGFATFAQHSSNEQFPIFPDCVNAIGKQQESCFYNSIQNYFYNNFKVPQELQEQNYKGTVIAVFEVDTSVYKTLKFPVVSTSKTVITVPL